MYFVDFKEGLCSSIQSRESAKCLKNFLQDQFFSGSLVNKLHHYLQVCPSLQGGRSSGLLLVLFLVPFFSTDFPSRVFELFIFAPIFWNMDFPPSVQCRFPSPSYFCSHGASFMFSGSVPPLLPSFQPTVQLPDLVLQYLILHTSHLAPTDFPRNL